MRHNQENIVADAEHTAHRFHGARHICRLYAADKNAGLQGRLLRLRLLPYAGRERQALGLRLQDDAGALQIPAMHLFLRRLRQVCKRM